MALAVGKLAGGNPERGRVDNDFYATDPKSTKALLDNVKFEGNSFLEPCCGQGHISKLIEEYYPNAEVVSQDLVDRGYGKTGIDFLTYEFDRKFDNVITNPPFKLAQDFIEKSLELLNDNGKVAMFLKINYLSGKKRYKEIYSKFPPYRVYVFTGRMSCSKNNTPEGFKMGAMDYVWMIWEKGKLAPTELRWIDN